VTTGQTGLAAIAAGWKYGLGLRNDGTVIELTSTNVPEGLTNVSAISVSAGFGLLITTNPPPPMLSGAAMPDSVVLHFPISVSGYVLEAATGPMQPYAEVGAYTNSFISTDPNNTGFVVPVEGTARFFRLKKR